MKTEIWISIKHDVETNVERAYQIAVIEARYSIRATYFVQSDLLEGNKALLHSIAKLGHEVTYHYDVLDANTGDMKLAIDEFAETVIKFEDAGFPVTSVCPHGNPLMNRNGWNSNKDFFRDTKVASHFSNIFDLVVQGKEKIKSDYKYVSDAGFGFKVITDIVGNDQNPSQDVAIANIDELTNLTQSNGSVIISTHPHRWVNSSFLASFAKARFIIIRRVALLASKSKILKKIMSKFYFLAKKI
ncbi:hypothetical protein H4J56_03415 [Colwellia sp. BRX8-4]|uniref:hypothetical protein n=1 Tax=Colwellia sp. BRX8-4 TaxID=2759836 RepID=UPI0015F40409|nr:hypothetical protein [Colwellia sp. BRX8-4]MBA6364329.1 hypothetical protein [Colwellia sp. BRX8-8]MBA6370472.1 hypothetical protein [Colwellia sp. BRX8-4]